MPTLQWKLGNIEYEVRYSNYDLVYAIAFCIYTQESHRVGIRDS
jgi:hypothetical protein